MAFNIFKLIDGPLEGFDELTGTITIEYRYLGLPIGEDLFRQQGIPPIDHVVMVKDTPLYLTKYGYIRDLPNENCEGSGKLVCTYTAEATNLGENFVRWERTYKKEVIALPLFVLKQEFYVKAGTTGETSRWTWINQGYQLPTQLLVLTATVQRISHDLSERSRIIQDMAVADAQVGKLHIITALGTTQWIMQPFIARQADPYRVELTYSWEADLGNGPMGYPDTMTDEDKKRVIVTTEDRPPWYAYLIRPQTNIIEGDDVSSAKAKGPKIYTAPLMPRKKADGTDNDWYEPKGYLKLPGKPFAT